MKLKIKEKIGYSIGASLMLAIISYYGYQANVAQSPESLHGIRICMTIVPAIIALAGMILLIFYNLTDRKLIEIEKELIKRKEE